MNKELQDKLPRLPEGYYWVVKDNSTAVSVGNTLFNPLTIQLVRERFLFPPKVVQEKRTGQTILSLTENAQFLYREEFPPEDTLVGEYR